MAPCINAESLRVPLAALEVLGYKLFPKTVRSAMFTATFNLVTGVKLS